MSSLENYPTGKLIMLLKLTDVTKRFGKMAAISNLSLEVQQGDILGIIGPNGAGKTTLFNVITGYYHGIGEIVFNGSRIEKLRPDQIAVCGIARTFQIPQIFDSMTIKQNVEVGAYFGSSSSENEKKLVMDSLIFVGLDGKEDNNAEDLKLFDKKLTMFAAALATKPKLLLLDEPIAGLGPIEAKIIVELIKKTNSKLGVTIIIIEHLIGILTELSGKLLVLNYGKEICYGPPEEVCKNPEVIEAHLGVQNA